MLNIIQIAKTPLLLRLRQKWMIPSCFPWKEVNFFGKEFFNWSSIWELWKRRKKLKNQSNYWNVHLLQNFLYNRVWKNLLCKTPILSFPNSVFLLLPIITPLILDQLTCSLAENITTFLEEKYGIIHFCLSPYKMVVLIMGFSKLDFST